MIGSAKAQGPGRYRIVWSKDPALRQLELPAELGEAATGAERDAHAAAVVKAVKEHHNLHRIARERQDWSPLLVGKDEPTYFWCEWIRVLVMKRWKDKIRAGALGGEEGCAVLLLLALIDVENYGGKKFERVTDDDWGKLAPASFLDEIRRSVGNKAYEHLITDLSDQVAEMEGDTGPL